MQSLVYTENSSGERTHPWVHQCLLPRCWMWCFPATRSASCCLQSGVWWSTNIRGRHCELGELLVGELRSNGMECWAEIHEHDFHISPWVSRWWRIWCSPMLIVSSTDQTKLQGVKQLSCHTFQVAQHQPLKESHDHRCQDDGSVVINPVINKYKSQLYFLKSTIGICTSFHYSWAIIVVNINPQELQELHFLCLVCCIFFFDFLWNIFSFFAICTFCAVWREMGWGVKWDLSPSSGQRRYTGSGIVIHFPFFTCIIYHCVVESQWRCEKKHSGSSGRPDGTLQNMNWQQFNSPKKKNTIENGDGSISSGLFLELIWLLTISSELTETIIWNDKNDKQLFHKRLRGLTLTQRKKMSKWKICLLLKRNGLESMNWLNPILTFAFCLLNQPTHVISS